jgi:hypothetical protein
VKNPLLKEFSTIMTLSVIFVKKDAKLELIFLKIYLREEKHYIPLDVHIQNAQQIFAIEIVLLYIKKILRSVLNVEMIELLIKNFVLIVDINIDFHFVKTILTKGKIEIYFYLQKYI